MSMTSMTRKKENIYGTNTLERIARIYGACTRPSRPTSRSTTTTRIVNEKAKETHTHSSGKEKEATSIERAISKFEVIVRDDLVRALEHANLLM
jgi:hypothetical protein